MRKLPVIRPLGIILMLLLVASPLAASHPPDRPEPGSAEALDNATTDPQRVQKILAVPRGEGIVVAFNFNPVYRKLNRSDYRLLWNEILNWSSLRPTVELAR